jgi:hypothetical protein
MADNQEAADVSAATAASLTAAASATTRAQKKANDEANTAAYEAADQDNAGATHSNKKEHRAPFRGKSEKMDGHVFQLPAESKKASQYSETIKQLQNVVNIEMNHPGDVAPLFEDPPREATIAEPSDLPPFLTNGTTRAPAASRPYIKWKRECEKCEERLDELKLNKIKIFTILMQQCSQGVTMSRYTEQQVSCWQMMILQLSA